LTCLPGGSTNVVCRTLGIPNDVVDATEHLLRMADDFEPRKVDTGRVNGRHFVFSSGIGLDASVVERVDSHPKLKARLGQWYFTWAGLSTFNRRYLVKPPRIRAFAGGREIDGVTAIIQNSDPFTFFGTRPIIIGRDVAFDSGTLALTVLKRATPLEMATLLPRIFSARPDGVARHRQVESLSGLTDFRVEAADGGTFPLQVDGDFIGEQSVAEFEIAPRTLAVVS
jgi:diacylglycerol kinase family enzyme